MRKHSIVGAVLLITLASGTMAVAGGLDKAYTEAVCTYFKVNQETVEAVKSVGITDEDIPVVFFVAQRSKSDPATIADVRARGDSWEGIVKSRNLGSDIFFQHVVGFIDSPTYFPIFEKYKTSDTSKWRSMPLADDEIVNLVNLKFIASQHDYSVFEVMNQRDRGDTFVTINKDVREAKDLWIAQQKEVQRKTANAGL